MDIYFPCNNKVPTIKEWQKLRQSTDNYYESKQVAALRGERVNKLTIDLDGFINEFKELDKTYKWNLKYSRSTPSGGYHIDCIYDSSIKTSVKNPINTNGDNLPIDIRSNGSYTIIKGDNYVQMDSDINDIEPTLKQFLNRELIYDSDTKSLIKNENILTEYITDLTGDKTSDNTDIPEFKDHYFREYVNGMYLYNRLNPSFCKFCKRIHDRDNTLFLTKKGETFIKHCRRGGSLPLVKLDDAWSCYDISNTTIKNIDSKYIPDLQEYVDNDIICIKSSMGSGKTYQLINFIKNNRPEDFLMLSFRCSFSMDIEKKFEAENIEINNYMRETTKMFKSKNMIIQAESLHRYDTRGRQLDLFIIDEFNSCRKQIQSNLQKRPYVAFTNFEWAIKYSKKLIIMDANLTISDIKMINKIRNDKTVFINNTRKHSSRKYIINTTHEFNTNLVDVLKRGKKVFLVSNKSSKSIQAITRIASRYCRAKSYTSVNKNEQKKAFLDINKTWSSYDFVAISPTITAGVDYTDVHFDYLFIDCCNMTCDVHSLRQMLGRVRHFKQDDTYICFKNFPTMLPVTIKDIETELKRNFSSIITDDNTKTCALFNYKKDKNGYYEFPKNIYYWLWLANKLEENKSRMFFNTEFFNQELRTGSTIKKKSLSADINRNIKKEIEQNVIDIKQEEAEELSKVAVVKRYDDSSTESKEFRVLKNKQSNNNLNDEEVLKLKLSYLLSKYNMDRNKCIPDKEDMEQWILRYSDNKMQQQFYNLSLLNRFKKMDGDIIDNIKYTERKRMKNKLSNISTDVPFLICNQNDTARKLRYTLYLMKMSDYNTDAIFNDATYRNRPILPTEDMLGDCKSYQEVYKFYNKKYTTKKMSSTTWTRFINKLVKDSFGININKKKLTDKTYAYNTTPNNNFRTDYDSGDELKPALEIFSH